MCDLRHFLPFYAWTHALHNAPKQAHELWYPEIGGYSCIHGYPTWTFSITSKLGNWRIIFMPGFSWEILCSQNSVGAFGSCGEILHRFGGKGGSSWALTYATNDFGVHSRGLACSECTSKSDPWDQKTVRMPLICFKNHIMQQCFYKMWFQNDLGINYVTWYCMRIHRFFWSLCSSCFCCFSITAVPIFPGLVAALAQSTSGSNWRAEPSILSLGFPSDGNEQKFGLLVSWQGNPGLEIYIYHIMICEISTIKYLNVTVTTIILESEW